MSTEDVVTALFCQIDDQMADVPQHPQASLYPSEIVTVACLFVLKGKGPRAFYRWLTRDWKTAVPQLPHRTRLFRVFQAHQDWRERLLADPTVLGVLDASGIELIHPIREGRSPPQIGEKRAFESSLDWGANGVCC
jgi:hypothetical protein